MLLLVAFYPQPYLTEITPLIGAGQKGGDFGLFRALFKVPVEITLEETS